MAGDGVLVSIGKDKLTSLYFPVCIQDHMKSKLLFFLERLRLVGGMVNPMGEDAW